MAESELEKAERRLAQAKARVQSLRNREATKQRKLDTRRKVILGGALIELAARDDGARAMLDRLVRGLAREQDRAAFEGWQPEEDGGGGGGEQAGSEELPSDGGGARTDAPRPAGLFGGR